MNDALDGKIISRTEVKIPKYNSEIGHVYILYNSENKPAYIGQSNCVFSRLGQHCRSWNLNNSRIEVISAKMEDLPFLENYLIKHLCPFLNKKVSNKALSKRQRSHKEMCLKAYLTLKRLSISDFSRKIGYQRTGIQGYLNGNVRLGKKAALVIHNETKGLVPYERVLEDNPPKKSETHKIKMKYFKNCLTTKEFPISYSEKSIENKKSEIEQYEFPLEVKNDT